MIHYFFVALTIVSTIVGVLGPIGALIAVVAAPTVAIPVISKLLGKFLSCLWCMLTAAVVVSVLSAYWLGHHAAVLDCRAGELAAKLAAQKTDLDAAEEAKSQAETAMKESQTRATESEKKVELYAEELKKRPVNAACTLGDGDFPGRVRERSKIRGGR